MPSMVTRVIRHRCVFCHCFLSRVIVFLRCYQVCMVVVVLVVLVVQMVVKPI